MSPDHACFFCILAPSTFVKLLWRPSWQPRNGHTEEAAAHGLRSVPSDKWASHRPRQGHHTAALTWGPALTNVTQMFAGVLGTCGQCKSECTCLQPGFGKCEEEQYERWHWKTILIYFLIKFHRLVYFLLPILKMLFLCWFIIITNNTSSCSYDNRQVTTA